jgi:hypothetical protein
MLITAVLRRDKQDVLTEHVRKLREGVPGARPMTREHLHKNHPAKAADVAIVTSFAAKHGLTVMEAIPEQRLVKLSGTTEKLAAAGITAATPVPPELAAVTIGILGFNTMTRRPTDIVKLEGI